MFRPQRLFATVLTAIVLILPHARPLWAEDVTLEKAYLRMIQGGIETGIIDADLLAAAEVVNQAKGQRRPRVALTFEYDKIRQNVLSSDNTAYATGASQYPKMTVALTVTQPLYDAVAFRQLPLAKAQKAAADAEAAVAVNKVVRDLITAFLEVGQAQIKVSRAKAVVAARVELERSLKEQIDA
ncbi:MAG: hypothetical protein EBU97_02170, partial [Rhodobacteraceae bacterium]|nr:hypothetical protein [Paracoccaceae bacterium]